MHACMNNIIMTKKMLLSMELKDWLICYLFMAVNDYELIAVVRTGDKSGAGFHGEEKV